MSEVETKNQMNESDIDIVGLDSGSEDNTDDSTFIIQLDGNNTSLTMDLKSISKIIETGLELEKETGGVPVIPLLSDSINPTQLALIVEYMNLCKQHNNSKDITKPPHPLKSKNLNDCAGEGLPKEVIDFVNTIRDNNGGMKMVYELISVCNYLDISGLMHLLCAYVAGQMKGLPMETVEKVLDPSDPTNGDEK